MPEREPRTKPRMTGPKGYTKRQSMPREARTRLMREYMEKGRELAERYGAGVVGAGDDGNAAAQKPETQAVQQVEDTLRDGAYSVGRSGRDAARQGKEHFMQSRRQKKARREYVAEKAGKAKKLRSTGRVRDVEHSGTSAIKNTGGKKAPKGRPGAAMPKDARFGPKTSKAAQVSRKMAGARAAQAARRMAVMIKSMAKAVVKVLSIIAGAAGPFVLILIAFAGIAMMIASPFGLFFSGEDTGGGVAPVSSVIREVAADFNAQVMEIMNAETWDELQIHYSGRRGNNWRDILAVFAVKTVLYDENAADVVTIDAEKAERIKAVFWDMTELSHRREPVEHYDEDTDTTTYTYILHITITQRDANAQADTYAFGQDQREILTDMLGGACDEYFRTLIGGAAELGGASPVVSTGSYIWPSDSSSRVTSYFGPREHPVTGEVDDHLGIDIGAPAGTNILAADAGRVVTAEWHWSYGQYIVIDHGGGRRTLYAHMSLLIAATGQNVAQGEVIGLVGATGVTDGAHIHFETHESGGRVDPLSYFSGYG